MQYMQFVRSAILQRRYFFLVHLNVKGMPLMDTLQPTSPFAFSRIDLITAGHLALQLIEAVSNPLSDQFSSPSESWIVAQAFDVCLVRDSFDLSPALLLQSNSNTLEAFRDCSGELFSTMDLLDSILRNWCLDTVLGPLLSIYLETRNMLSNDGTGGWTILSHLSSFVFQTLDTLEYSME
jgi:hypothetical protein